MTYPKVWNIGLAITAVMLAADLCGQGEPCPNSTPVDEQFVAALVGRENTLGDFQGTATLQPSGESNIQVEISGRTSGFLSKVVTHVNGMIICTQYYDGQFFWYERGNLIIKIRSAGRLPPDPLVSMNPMHLIGQLGDAEAQYSLCGYETVAGRYCAVIGVRLLAVNEKSLRSIVPTFTAADILGSTTLLWLDIGNGFPYKTEVYDRYGSLTSSVTFTSLEFQPVPTCTFIPSIGNRTVTQMSLSEFFSEAGKEAIANQILSEIEN